MRRQTHYRNIFGRKDLLNTIYSRKVACFPIMSFDYSAMLKHDCGFLGAYQAERGLFMPWELTQILRSDFAMEGLEQLRAFEERQDDSFSGIGNDFARIVETVE